MSLRGPVCFWSWRNSDTLSVQWHLRPKLGGKITKRSSGQSQTSWLYRAGLLLPASLPLLPELWSPHPFLLSSESSNWIFYFLSRGMRESKISRHWWSMGRSQKASRLSSPAAAIRVCDFFSSARLTLTYTNSVNMINI